METTFWSLVCQKYMVDKSRVNMQWVITYTVLYAQYSFSIQEKKSRVNMQWVITYTVLYAQYSFLIQEKQTQTRCGHE